MPYKTITIFDLLKMYLDKKPMPQRIRYWLMRNGYEYFRWDDDAEEYICEGDPTDPLRCEVPWHHMMDEVEIIEEARE